MNEKMRILGMLERGQINAEEASRLLSATDGARPTSDNGNGPRPHSDRKESGTFSSDLSKRFDTFIKDAGPKARSLVETGVEKTVKAADRLSRSINNSYAARPAPRLAPRPANPQQRPTAPTRPRDVAPQGERTVEMVVDSMDSELSLSVVNGRLSVKGYNGDKISAKIFARSKRAGANVELMKLGNKYYLNYDEDGFEQVSVDAYVPETMFYVIRMRAVNGAINAASVRAAHVWVESDGGDTELTQIHADTIKVDCRGRLRINDVSADACDVEVLNSSADVSALDARELKLTTFNGAINFSMPDFKRFDAYTWAVESQNGRMDFSLPSARDLGYHIKARASLADVRMGLVGLTYVSNERGFVEARSSGFESAYKKVRLALETAGAPLSVN